MCAPRTRQDRDLAMAIFLAIAAISAENRIAESSLIKGKNPPDAGKHADYP